MEIINVKITDLKPYENNPRRNNHAVEYVANSIKEFGFKVPIVIDNNNVIIAGHTRYKAALLLNLDAIPCLYANDLTEAQIKAYRLADNKTAEIAEWDIEALDIELEEITLDMTEFGFDLDIIDPVYDESSGINDNEKEKTLQKCPECGHINEKRAFQIYES